MTAASKGAAVAAYYDRAADAVPDLDVLNYGYASDEPTRVPAGDPEHHSLRLYEHVVRGVELRGARVLEVSCGRGGGLNALLSNAPELDATGLDVAESAIAFCRRTYGENDRLRFVPGSALNLPFADASFDVVLNVEASNDYGDRRRFFNEAARVLKPDGVLLFADTVRRGRHDDVAADLAAAGFRAELQDITANVAEACRLDTPRRREIIDRQAPLLARMVFGKQLENYAAVEGSNKYRAFCEGRRRYVMAAAVKA